MLNLDILVKGLGIVSLPYFVYDFSGKFTSFLVILVKKILFEDKVMFCSQDI